MKRERTIDVLKGFAIILVVITHFSWGASERLRFLFPFWINMAVPIFMLVSGYVSAKSYNRKAYSGILDFYHPMDLISKVIRYTIPFLFAYLIEITVPVLSDDHAPGFYALIKNFLMGGTGPGGYYYPIMIQFVFVYPLIYRAIKQGGKRALFVLFCLNVFYETLCFVLKINGGIYRLVLFRYLFLISFGCYVACGYSIRKIFSVVLFIGGLCMNYLISYKKVTFFIYPDWASTSLFATAYILPIFYYLTKKSISCKPLEYIGQASYNIFLTQKVFYIYAGYVYAWVDNRILRLAVCVVVCLVVGIIYYQIETPITKRILKLLKNT